MKKRKSKSLRDRIAEIGIVEGAVCKEEQLMSYEGCLVDASGNLLVQADCTVEQTEELQKLLRKSEAIVILPAYYRHQVVKGVMPLDVVHSFSRWLITRDGIFYIPTNRRPDPYFPQNLPQGCEKKGQLFVGIWETELEERLTVLRQAAMTEQKSEKQRRQVAVA